MKRLRSIDLFFIAFLAVALFFIFANLGTSYLWEDEAETALVAKTIWTQGIPKTTDGKNFFYQEQGKRVGYGDVWAWTPWLQFYIAAASLKVLGWNEWAARLPFAIVGFFSIPMFYLIGKKIFDVLTARIGLILLTSSVTLMLYFRQCRYYSIVVFATLWIIYSLINLAENQNKKSLVFIFIGLFLLFHANYITWFGTWLSILIFTFFKILRPVRKQLLVTLFLAFLINLPWFFLFKPLHEKTRDFDLHIVLDTFVFYVSSLNQYVMPMLLLAFIPVALHIVKIRTSFSLSSQQKSWLILLGLIIANTLICALFGPAKVFRYLISVVPILILISAVVLRYLWSMNRWITALFLLLLIFTNYTHTFGYAAIKAALPSPLNEHFKSKHEYRLAGFIHEVLNPPRGTIYHVVQHLKQNAAEDDLIVATYGELPLMFYTNLRMIGGLSFQALDEARNADWVLPRKVFVSDQDARVMSYLIDQLDWSRYEKMGLPVTDFPWENIPEPNSHQFRTIPFEAKWQVHLYRKLKPEEPSRSPEPPDLFYFNLMRKSIQGTKQFQKELVHYLLWLKWRTGKLE